MTVLHSAPATAKLYILQGSQYEIKMCSECIRSDTAVHGVAYSHRSHNFPEIDICHLHGVRLSYTCEGCGIQHLKHKLSAYQNCINLSRSTPHAISPHTTSARKFALFLHTFLNRPKEIAINDRHEMAVHSRAADLGLYIKNQFSQNSIVDFSNKYYEENPTNTGLDTPSRARIGTTALSTLRSLFALFHTFDEYLRYYENHGTLDNMPGKIGEILKNRSELSSRLRSSQASSIEQFQAANSTLVSWLREADASWTSTTLCRKFESNSYAPRIQHRLSSITALEPTLYATDRPPEKTNYAYIWKKLGLKGTYKASVIGKEAHLECERLTESNHHYYVRLILWAAANNEKDVITIGTLASITKISAWRLRPILEHFDWLGKDKLINICTLPESVDKLRISRKWTLT